MKQYSLLLNQKNISNLKDFFSLHECKEEMWVMVHPVIGSDNHMEVGFRTTDDIQIITLKDDDVP